MPSRESTGSPVVFIVCVAAIQVLGICSMVLVGVWMGKYQGGFAWDGSKYEFNYHPLCMVIGMVFLYSEAMIVYRVFRHENKALVKMVHFALQILAFVVIVCGLKAAFDFHNNAGIPNMYSLHSWCGLGTVLLFSFQLVFGFVSFLFPRLPDAPRESYLRVHTFFGVFIFVLAIGTCLMGITENLLFKVKTYSTFPAQGVLANILGLLLVLLAGFVVFVVTNPGYKRVDSDEQAPLMADKDHD